MRAFRDRIVASCLILSAASTATGQVPGRRVAIGDVPPPPGQGPAKRGLVLEVTPAPRPFDEAQAAGLPIGTKLQVLTLQDAYRSALGEKPGAGGPAPDFARLREALASGKAGFVDPTADYLDLLRKRMDVETGAQRAAVLHRVLGPLTRSLGAGSGITPLTLNQVTSTLLRALSDRDDRELAYQDALDRFKARLQIAPDAAIVPDVALVGSFREVFGTLRRWWDQNDESRLTEDLSAILDRLPKAADVTIDGRSAVDVATKHPEGLADLLASATRLAGREGLATRVRVRRLVRIAGAVDGDREELYWATLRRDNAQRLVNSPPQGANVDTQALITSNVQALIEADSACSEAQSRLVRDWAEGHALRIAIARDLGTLPEADWDAFLKSFVGPPPTPKTP